MKCKDVVDCEKYISKMRLMGLETSNSFFCNLDETSIEVNPISLANELGYPEVLRIPDFVSKASASYMADTEFDYDKLSNIKIIILSSKLSIDKDLTSVIMRFRGLKEIRMTKEQYTYINRVLGEKIQLNSICEIGGQNG